jgi:hypothetical protein
MTRRYPIILAVFVTLLLVVNTSSAHVPIAPGDGESIDEAIHLEDPTKSWVIYSDIHHEGEAQYFEMHFHEDDIIKISLMIPVDHIALDFRPQLILMGPNLTSQGVLPSGVETPPEDVGIIVFESHEPEPEYEGFTPTSFYTLLDVNMVAPDHGEYYIAVYDPSELGRFAMALGYREEFTLDEWILVPLSVMTIHQWTGQDSIALLTPILIGFFVVLTLILWRIESLRSTKHVPTILGVAATALFAASGIFVFYQIFLALLSVPVNAQVLITTLFAATPIVLALASLRILSKPDWSQSKDAAPRLALLSLLGLFLWAGWTIGPLLMLIAGVSSFLVNTPKGMPPEGTSN